MNDSRELLALRKEVLVARSGLYRLRLARDVAAIREGVSLSRAGSAIAGSGTGRELALGPLVSGLGGGRVARILATAGRVLVIARLALAAYGLVRSKARTP